MSVFIGPSTLPIVSEFTANLAQAAATYTLATVTGSIIIDKMSFYMATAGATFTSVAVKSNATTVFTFLSAADGAVANLVAQANLTTTWTQAVPVILRTGQLIQYIIVGSTGTGSMIVNITWRPNSVGASIA